MNRKKIQMILKRTERMVMETVMVMVAAPMVTVAVMVAVMVVATVGEE